MWTSESSPIVAWSRTMSTSTPASSNEAMFDRVTAQHVLFGTAILVLLLMGVALVLAWRKERRLAKINIQAAIAFGVLGVVAALAIPLLIDQQAVGVIIGAVLGAGGVTLAIRRDDSGPEADTER